ncbi:hypothetical protein AVEN_258871-1 [Araneus ventricosus]|uniref:DUF5641 domain-containing protein n=1 Tax=Araneus ventricosus TaxID=182803 RepID=A0A4Y2I6H0_ARAVE|nr:hypothetical protein AVEN_258871-1 [Araneus ventricosus]
MINSRPLTYQNEQADSVSLTLAHFLIGRHILSVPNMSALPPSTKNVITRRRKHPLNLNYFWNRWRKNYLVELRSAHQAKPSATNPVLIKKDSIVQIHVDEVPKMMWKCGLVTELHMGKDGKTRLCIIRLPSGTFLERLVQLITLPTRIGRQLIFNHNIDFYIMY